MTTRQNGSMPPAGRKDEREHEGRDEQHGDQRHAAHELDVADGERAQQRERRAPCERQRDADRRRCGHADQRQDHGQRQAAPAVGADRLEAEHAADHQREEEREGDRPAEGERARAAPRPERRQRAGDQHRQHRAGRQRRPPLLLVRVAAEQDQAPLLGDEAPARSWRRLAGRVVRRGDGVDHAPVEQVPAGPGERAEQDQRDQARAGPGEEARARSREQVRGRQGDPVGGSHRCLTG